LHQLWSDPILRSGSRWVFILKITSTLLMEFQEAAAPAATAVRQALNDRCAAIRSDAELALNGIASEAGVGIIRSGAW
jgi:hypothetical protein